MSKQKLSYLLASLLKGAGAYVIASFVISLVLALAFFHSDMRHTWLGARFLYDYGGNPPLFGMLIFVIGIGLAGKARNSLRDCAEMALANARLRIARIVAEHTYFHDVAKPLTTLEESLDATPHQAPQVLAAFDEQVKEPNEKRSKTYEEANKEWEATFKQVVASHSLSLFTQIAVGIIGAALWIGAAYMLIG